MEHYRQTLEHIAEPSDPAERRSANSVDIEDWQALLLADYLREFAHYGNHTNEAQPDVALGYAEYIDQQVRSLGEHIVTLYAHTCVAQDTFIDAVVHNAEQSDKYDAVHSVFADKAVELIDTE